MFLPAETVGETTTHPYILILDQVPEGEIEHVMASHEAWEQTGARAVLGFRFTVDVI